MRLQFVVFHLLSNLRGLLFNDVLRMPGQMCNKTKKVGASQIEGKKYNPMNSRVGNYYYRE